MDGETLRRLQRLREDEAAMRRRISDIVYAADDAVRRLEDIRNRESMVSQAVADELDRWFRL